MRPVNNGLVITGLCLAALLGGCGPTSENRRDDQSAKAVAAPAPTQSTSETLSATETQTKSEPVIVMLGDSLTAGFGLPSDAALPDVLARSFIDSGQAVSVINAGVSGDTTGGGLARYDWSVKAQAADILVIALGANDYLQGVDPQVTRANLTALLERAKADGLKTLLVGVTPRTSFEQDARAALYAGIYPELAEAFNVPLLGSMLEDIRDQPRFLQQDGLHPTAEGVKQIVPPIKAALLPLLESLEEG